MLYRIKNWNAFFENNESRKLVNLRWFPCPNKFDGLTFRKITMQKNASDLFCGWILILEIASKSSPRGLLGKSPDTPGYSPDDMGLMTGFPVKIFEVSIKFFSDKQIGWIENISPDTSGDSPDTSGKSPAEGIEGMEGKVGNTAPAREINNKWEKPKYEDVAAFCKERGKGVNPENWFAHYESNGWMVGKNHMKNWKAAVITWENNALGKSPEQKPENIRRIN